MTFDTLRADSPASTRELTLPRLSLAERVRLARPTLSWWQAGAIVALLVLGSLFVRTRAIHVHLWIDEAISIGIASHPLHAIPHLLREDGSPPLYYLLLHLWMSAFGRSTVATHELSLVISLITIPVAYWAGRSLYDRATGLIAAAIAALLPYGTIYAQETRMYALVVLLSVIVATSFLHAFVHLRKRYIPLFAVSLAATMYTHNWGLFLAALTFAAYLLCVWWRPPERRALLTEGLLAFGGVAVLYAPWVPTLIYQAGHTGAPWALPPVAWSLSQGMYFITGGRGAAVALLLGGGAGLLALRHVTRARGRTQLTVACLLLMGVGTLLLAWAYSKTTPAWAFRYVAVILGPLLLLFSLGLARGGRLALVALALTFCFWVLDPQSTGLNYKSNVGSVAADFRQHLGSNPLVLSTQPEQIPTLFYYLPSVRHFGTPLGRVSDPGVTDWRGALEKFRASSVRGTLMPMVQALRPGQRVLLVTPLGFPHAPEWMRLIRHSSLAWTHALQHDRELKWIAYSNTGGKGATVGVQGLLFVRR